MVEEIEQIIKKRRLKAKICAAIPNVVFRQVSVVEDSVIKEWLVYIDVALGDRHGKYSEDSRHFTTIFLVECAEESEITGKFFAALEQLKSAVHGWKNKEALAST